MDEKKPEIFNLEPNWVGLWRYFTHMKQTNPSSFEAIFPDGEGDEEWVKIKRLGEAGCESVQEYIDQQKEKSNVDRNGK